MEKQAIIEELRQKQALWNKIVPLTEECTRIAAQKGSAIDRRDRVSSKKYLYIPDIKIKNELPENNAKQISDEIAQRHKKDCIKAAKKKLPVARFLLFVATIIGIILTVYPHITNLTGGNMDAYNTFSGLINFNLREDVAEFQEIVNMVLALFCAGAQSLAILLAGVAAASIVKSKACSRVPELGHTLKVFWIVATVIAGMIAAVTWFSVNPIGMVGLVPIVVLLPILIAIMSGLDDSRVPRPTADEYTRLEKAKEEDARNMAANETARREANAKEEKKFKLQQKKHIDEYTKEIADYDLQIDTHTSTIANLMKQTGSSVIPEKDNNLYTITKLLDYLENDRADTLKEALHMVDMDKEREKDRATQLRIAQMKMENDRYLADLDRKETQRYNDQLLAQQRAHNESVKRELDRHNAQIEREQEELNREVKKEIERLKNK